MKQHAMLFIVLPGADGVNCSVDQQSTSSDTYLGMVLGQHTSPKFKRFLEQIQSILVTLKVGEDVGKVVDCCAWSNLIKLL